MKNIILSTLVITTSVLLHLLEADTSTFPWEIYAQSKVQDFKNIEGYVKYRYRDDSPVSFYFLAKLLIWRQTGFRVC